ncbi:glutamate racemase [Hwanghaeella sp. LZ110]|jgi:glutamate racemase|uniref:glutamate racemase n=1 Tax=Hwanghaeella sp. LZ110 TaxID=3402810 RepID=UPI003B678120
MIGVFDSGHGGLTVLRALAASLPEERFVYLGDHAYAPYGMRSDTEIYQLTRRRVKDLIDRGCGLVIIACNTASAIALRRLQQEWLPGYAPTCRILGVFVPMVEALTDQSWYVQGPSPYAPKQQAKTIGIFATRRTVESKAYPEEVKRRLRSVSVIQQACPRLVEAIEEGLSDDLITRGVARYCEQLLAKAGRSKLDLVVLGCTHFPLIEQDFRAALPAEVKIMDQPSVVTASLISYLDRHPEYRRAPTELPGVDFLTSGDPTRVRDIAQRFYGALTPFKHLSGIAADEPMSETDQEEPKLEGPNTDESETV